VVVSLDDEAGMADGKRPLWQMLILPVGLLVSGSVIAVLWLLAATALPEPFGVTWLHAAATRIGVPLPPGWLIGIGLSAAGGLAAVAAMARATWRELGQVADADALFEDVAHAGADFIWHADVAGRLTALSEGFERRAGRSRAAALGRTWDEVPGLAFADAARRTLGMTIAAARAFRDVEATMTPPDGEVRHVRLIGRPFFVAGRLAGYRGVVIDITDVVETRQRLYFVDRHDTLTGLLNRLGAVGALAGLLGRSRRPGESPVLLIVGIDRFRGINEAFGAAAGDMIAQQVAERIRVCAHAGDLLGRLSPDEFMLLRPASLPFDPLVELTARLEQTLDERFSVAQETLKVGCNIGIYEIAADDRDAETCLRRAQLAVSRARRDGRSSRLFMDGMDLEAETIRRLEEELRHAVDDNKLALAYQPQLDLRTGRYVGAEALMRWHHREHGFISPSRFIPLAERTGVVVELGRWAVRQACLDSRRLGGLQLAVNLSPIDLAAPDCVEQLAAVLEDTGMDPGRLELEITEGVLIEDTDATLDVLLRLKRLGLKIALDDFGTGYAGLGYLQVFPFDKLKIDQSFIRRITRSRHAASIVRSVVALAHDLDLTVCAEGVETEDQLRLLRAEGCDVVQGFFAGQPMAASQLRAMVERQRTGTTAAVATPEDVRPRPGDERPATLAPTSTLLDGA
jgi:diguanylate cyclase (GGDEF)-like protein/PAS domain S-box-containing protein